MISFSLSPDLKTRRKARVAAMAFASRILRFAARDFAANLLEHIEPQAVTHDGASAPSINVLVREADVVVRSCHRAGLRYSARLLTEYGLDGDAEYLERTAEMMAGDLGNTRSYGTSMPHMEWEHA